MYLEQEVQKIRQLTVINNPPPPRPHGSGALASSYNFASTPSSLYLAAYSEIISSFPRFTTFSTFAKSLLIQWRFDGDSTRFVSFDFSSLFNLLFFGGGGGGGGGALLKRKQCETDVEKR